MSTEYATIIVARKEMTSELIEKVFETDFCDTGLEYLDKELARRNDKRVENGEPIIPIGTTTFEKLVQYEHWRTDGTFQFSGETNADDHMSEEACKILRDAGVTYEFYLANDESDADETIWSPKDYVKYDVSKEGHPLMPLIIIEKIMSAKTDREKVELMEKEFRERSSYGHITPQKIAAESVNQLSEIDDVLVQLDAGAITQSDAMEMIKEIKLKGA